MNKDLNMNSFEITSGAIFASDPCYDSKTNCAAKIDNVKNGSWNYEINVDNNRISELTIWHKNSKDLHWKPFKSDFGVDSGQFGFFDYQYFLNHENEREYGIPGFYNDCCEATLNDPYVNTIANAGVVSSSGYGDGSYPVYVAHNNEGQVVALRVFYIEEDDDEEEYYEKYEEEDV